MKYTLFENILFKADDHDLLKVYDKTAKKLVTTGHWYEDKILEFCGCGAYYEIYHTPYTKIYNIYV